MKTVRHIIERGTDERYRVGAFTTKLGADNLGMLAGFLSWSILTAVIPIVVGVVALSSLFLQNPTIEQQVIVHLSNALQGVLSPRDIESLVATVLTHSGLFAVIGVVGILWGSSNVGGSIATAFQAIFETAGRPFVKQKLIDLCMLFIMTATMFLVIAGSLVAAYLDKLVEAQIPGAVQFFIGSAISFTAAFALFASIYSVFPNIYVQFKKGNVWRGALLAGALFVIVSYIWPLYVHISHFSRYSAFLFSLVVLTAWIYLFSMILLVGAEVVAIAAIRQAQRHHASVGPAPQRILPQHRVLRQARHSRADAETAMTPTQSEDGGAHHPRTDEHAESIDKYE